MRFRTIGLCLVLLAMATVAAAQTKVTGVLQCGKPEVEQSVPAGDQPDHLFGVSKVSCNWTKAMDVAGFQSKTGTSTSINEITGSNVKAHGQHVSTMATGEKTFVRFEGSTILKEGVAQTAQGSWSYTGGTGKLEGIKGKGTYKGKANPDGTITYEVEGEYTLPPK